MTNQSRFHWWISLVLLGLGGALGVAFWGPRSSLATVPRRPEDQAVLRVACTQRLVPDPHRRFFPLPQYNQLILSLWEPLIECDPATNQPRPAAAESWTWSPDRLTLTLRLRPDAHWSNGDPVTAHDFVRGWLRLLRQKIEVAQTLFQLRNAEAFHHGKLSEAQAVGLQAVDDYTLRLSLDQPRSTLVVELADPLLSPLHATNAGVFAQQAYLKSPAALVTNGPFRLAKADDDGFRLEVCPNYHDSASVRLAGVQFVRTDSLDMAPLLLAAGIVDLLTPTAFGPAREMPTQRPVKVENELELAVDSLDFNVTRGPLRDVRVRQALALALNRSGPIEKYDPGHMVAAWSWVPSMPGREGLVVLQEDARAARRLLAAAGYPGGQGFPVLRIALPLWMKGDPFPSAWSEGWFQELGVRTYIAYDSPKQRAARMQAGDYDVLCNSLTATVPDAGDLLDTFLWPPEMSGTKWTDAEVVALLNAANRQTGPERLALLERAERRIMAAVPTIPVMFSRRQTMRAGEVRGWYPDPLGRHSLKRLWLDIPPVSNQAAEQRS
jgi:oligopeptide transport system substrate-binding protein